MGFWNRKKKIKSEPLPEQVQTTPDIEQIRKDTVRISKTKMESKEECIEFMKNQCECILEATRLSDEAKQEYAKVSAQLMDVQRVEREENKQVLIDAARQLCTLLRAIENYRGRTNTLNASQYACMEKYEEELPEKIRRMEAEEQHFVQIKSDMRYLDEEKNTIRKKKNFLFRRQAYLRRIAITTVVLMIILCSLFFAISIVFEVEMVIPYMLTVALAAISGTYLFLEARKTKAGLMLQEQLGNRAILLMNKVKIKYINSSKLLDYYSEKYGASGSEELRYQFREYLKAKEDALMYRKNTEQKKKCQELMKQELSQMGISDTEVWLYQATALLDEREMVEVRHRLNQSRQKLRVQIDEQEQLKQQGLSMIEDFLENNPSYKPAMIKVLGDYKILI